jgi:hypothetical protein
MIIQNNNKPNKQIMILFAKKLNDALHIVEPPAGWDKIANNELVKVTLKKKRFIRC